MTESITSILNDVTKAFSNFDLTSAEPIQTSDTRKSHYLFPCTGFPCSQLYVPCYQLITTWKSINEKHNISKNVVKFIM